MPDGSRLAPALGTAVLTLPNVITFARLCAVPVAVWLVLRRDTGAAFWLFVAAGASDAVDGWLARRHGVTRFGTLLDPLADKTLLVSMYVTLAAIGAVPSWLAILVVFRDGLILCGIALLALLGQPPVISPLPISKANTAMQIVLVALTLLLTAHALPSDAPLRLVRAALEWVVAATTFASGTAYVLSVGRSR